MLSLNFVFTVATLTALGVLIAHAAPKIWQRSALRARWTAQEAAQRIRGTR